MKGGGRKHPPSSQPLSAQQPPSTVVDLSRGELIEQKRPSGHALIWLWPAEPPAVPTHPNILSSNNKLGAVSLDPGHSVTILRGMVPEPMLNFEGGTWTLMVPSDKTYADVSRSPTTITLQKDNQLTIQTEARGPQRFWVDLFPVDGPCPPAPVSPWSALAVGPVVLWYVEKDLQTAEALTGEPDPALAESAPGFRFYSRSTGEVIANVKRRANMRIPVPQTAVNEQWEAGQPFILAGEPGSGKTTLAKAAYRAAGDAGRFAAVHPVAVEHEIDLVAFTGCANYAHDGARVPDQTGHLDVLTHKDGILLIDEIHTLDDNLKKHLLDILTEWTFRPRGDNTRRKQVRGLFVFASNRMDRVRDPSSFPHDLFARMGGDAGVIEIPPLRRRRFELPFLAEDVLSELDPPMAFHPDAMRKLLLHRWPLNYWELQDVLREAHSLGSTRGESELLPEFVKLRTTQPPPEPELSPTPPIAGKSWTFPSTVGWPELFVGLYHHRTFAGLRDAWQAQLGARNAAAVNRRIGRLIRCDQCDPGGCTKCFCGVLAAEPPHQVADRLALLAHTAHIPAGDAAGWILDGLRQLVVERVSIFKKDSARAPDEVIPLLETLRRRLIDA